MLLAEVLKVSCVAFVVDVLHAHMNGLDVELRAVDTCLTGQQLEQAERVFST